MLILGLKGLTVTIYTGSYHDAMIHTVFAI